MDEKLKELIDKYGEAHYVLVGEPMGNGSYRFMYREPINITDELVFSHLLIGADGSALEYVWIVPADEVDDE